MLDGEDASTRKFGDLGKKRRSVELFRRTIAITKRVKNADGIELGVGFFYETLDIVLVVPTMIIASIGEDEQGTFGVVCTPHLAKAEIDGVEEGGSAFGSGHHHAALQVFDAVGEGAGQFGAFIEADEEKLILRVGGLEELDRCLARFINFVGHAATEIENNAYRNGDIFRRKADNFLLRVVFKNAEVVRIEAGNETVERVGNGDIHQSKVDVRADHLTRFNGYRRRVTRDVTKLGEGRRGRSSNRFWLRGTVLRKEGQSQA